MKYVIAACCAAILAGCATPPDQITATHVATSKFDSYSCQQLATGIAKVNTSLGALSATQRQASTDDAVGVLFIGLPIGSMTNSNNDVREAEIARMKGEMNAMFAAQKSKGCAA